MSSVPQKWIETKLADICNRIDYGYTASAIQESDGPKFLRITDIAQNYIDWSNVPYCKIDKESSLKYKIQPGDIVIARTGATSGYAKYIGEKRNVVFASYLVRIRINPEYDSRYIGYIVESDEYKRFIWRNIGGSAQPNANARILTSFPLRLPPLELQILISRILSAYDSLIENNRRRIHLLEEMARTLYREWFVHFRFPGHEEVELADSELGEIPDGWKVKKLKDVITLEYGKGLRKADRSGEKFPVYGSSGIIDYHKEKLVDGPGIIVGRKGNPGKVNWSQIGFYPIDTTYYVSTNFSLYYVYYHLDEMQFIDTHTAVPGLSRDSAYLKNFLVPIPKLIERFEDLVKPIFVLNYNIKKLNENLQEIRNSLLPKLVSGQIDVSDLKIEIPPDTHKTSKYSNQSTLDQWLDGDDEAS